MANPFAAYLETKVLTASPLQLVHLAYEGAMESVAEARSHLAAQDIHGRACAITRAQQIVTELQASLDFERGGEISTRLASLYEYMQQRLNAANFEQKDEPLAEVHQLLATVNEAWKELAADTATESVTSSPAASPSAWMTPEPATYDYARSAYTL
jgi:flagellar secretion chaperone FliS